MNTKSSHPCPYCATRFEDHEALKAHVVAEHGTEPLPKPYGLISLIVNHQNVCHATLQLGPSDRRCRAGRRPRLRRPHLTWNLPPNWQLDDEVAAGARRALDPHAATVRLNQPLDYSQAHARARHAFRRSGQAVELIKDAVALGERNARASILHSESQPPGKVILHAQVRAHDNR